MPIYEYDCAECGRRFEKRLPSQQMDSVARCVYCDAPRIVRAISHFSTPRGRAARQDSTLLSIGPPTQGGTTLDIDNCVDCDISNVGRVGDGTVVRAGTNNRNIRFNDIWQKPA